MESKNIANILRKSLVGKGINLDVDVKLPQGKSSGGLVLTRKNGEVIFYGMIKESPYSSGCKKVRKQLLKYKDHFGDENSYAVISPSHDEDLFIDFLGGEKEPWKHYVSNNFN